MRLVGYIRESADRSDTRSGFAQQEELRRYAADRGHQIVSICQDSHRPGEQKTRHGYVSLLGVIAAGGVDAVLVPGLATLSSDAIVQEIMLWDLRNRGVRVVSTESADVGLLDDGARLQPDRLVIRDVLERVEEHSRSLGEHGLRRTPPVPDTDVVIHLVAAETADFS